MRRCWNRNTSVARASGVGSAAVYGTACRLVSRRSSWRRCVEPPRQGKTASVESPCGDSMDRMRRLFARQ